MNEISSPIFIHELFHGVFARHFRLQHEGKTLTYYELKSKLEREHAENQSRMEGLPGYLESRNEIFFLEFKIGLASETKSGPTKEMELLLAKLKVEHERLYKEAALMKDFEYHFTISDPYDELFADFASALFHNDGRIMSMELHERNNQAYHRRNFTQIQSFKNWATDDHNYGLFDPSRAAIWKLLQKNLDQNARPDTILQSFLLATRAHIEMRQSRDQAQKQQETPEKLNQEFFRLFVFYGKYLRLWSQKT